MPEIYDYSTRVNAADLNSPKGVGIFIAEALKDWREEDINDLQFDELLQRAVDALNESSAIPPNPA